MQERVKTSFIPKASLEVERKRPGAGNPVALVSIVAGALLVLSIVTSAGVFFFENYTKQSIESKRASLERSRAAFEPATIRELSRLNTRIETGKSLLEKHVALTLLFGDLERRTLSTVRFSSIAYEINGTGEVTLTMEGQATSFNSVALQSEEFSKSDILKDPIFENVNISQSGAIEFDFTAVIDESRLTFQGGTTNEPVSPVPTL